MWFLVLPFNWHAHLLVSVLGMPCLKQPNMLMTILKCAEFFEVNLKGVQTSLQKTITWTKFFGKGK
jgi:hypothetical protein